jgi:vancomycin resistance protein YoaR
LNSTETKNKITQKSQKGKRAKKTSGFFIVLPILVVAVLAAAFFTWAVAFYDGIYPNIYFNDVKIGGLTKQEAISRLNTRYLHTSNESIKLIYKESEIEITASEAGAKLNAEDIAEAAYLQGREGSFFSRLGSVTTSVFTKKQVDGISPDYDKIKSKVMEIANELERDTIASNYRVENYTLIIQPANSGKTVDVETIADKVYSEFKNLNYVEVNIEGFITEEYSEDLKLEKLYDEIYTEALDAKLVYDENNEYTIAEHVVGVSFDLKKAKELYSASDSEVQIPLIFTQPDVTKEDLEALLFRDVLAEVKTTLNANNKNRTGNVSLSASACNGTILVPGEVFSYNKTVGQRTYENGYKDASVYISGGIEDQLGGGICQTSSTLYMAVIRAQLKPEERYNHSYTVVYTPLGEDATVYWGSLDFKFSNNREYPIKIEAFQKDDYIVVRIYGTKVDDNTFKIETVVHSHTPYSTVEKESQELEFGVRKQDVEGHSAYRTTTYGVVYNSEGKEIDRYKINDSRYSKLDRVILVGVKNKPVEPTPTPPQPTQAPSDVTSPPQNTQPPTGAPPAETQPPQITPPPASTWEPSPEAPSSEAIAPDVNGEDN